MKWSGIAPMAAFALALSCFSPDFQDGQFRCSGATGCPSGLTCVDGRCERDGEASDAAGTIDAPPGTDGSTADAPVDDGATADAPAQCNDGCSTCDGLTCCTELCPTGGTCTTFSCDNSECDCKFDCREAANCSTTCKSSSCEIDCRQTNNCLPTCEGGAECDIDCKNAVTCGVSCLGGATRCTVDCTGAAVCVFSDCNNPTMCPNNIMVCNQPCP